VAIGFVAAVYFRRKQGTADNQFIGVTWALGLLACALWSLAGRTTVQRVLAGAVALPFFALTLADGLHQKLLDQGVRVPALRQTLDVRDIRETQPKLVELAESGLVWQADYADLNVPTQDKIFPTYYNFADVLAAGEQPRWLLSHWLDRKFLYTSIIDPVNEPYPSAFGKFEENYLWKINQIIQARYKPDPGADPLLVRRPGPEPARWMRQCFSPFDVAGVSWRIRRGGGFWCQPGDGQLRMRGSSQPRAELLTTEDVESIRGTTGLNIANANAGVTFEAATAAGGFVSVRIRRDVREPGPTLVGVFDAVGKGTWEAVPEADDGVLRIDWRQGDQASVTVGRRRIAVVLPELEGPLSLWADQTSDARLDMTRVRIG
jgi:hypothetical protein